MTFGETAGTPARDDAAFSRTEFSTSVRGAVWSLDPQLAIALPRTMRAVMATALAEERFRMTLVAWLRRNRDAARRTGGVPADGVRDDGTSRDGAVFVNCESGRDSTREETFTLELPRIEGVIAGAEIDRNDLGRVAITKGQMTVDLYFRDEGTRRQPLSWNGEYTLSQKDTPATR